MECNQFTHATRVCPAAPQVINWSYYPNPDTSWLIDDARFAVASSQPLNGTVISVDTDSGGNFTESMWSGVAFYEPPVGQGYIPSAYLTKLREIVR